MGLQSLILREPVEKQGIVVSCNNKKRPQLSLQSLFANDAPLRNEINRRLPLVLDLFVLWFQPRRESKTESLIAPQRHNDALKHNEDIQQEPADDRL